MAFELIPTLFGLAGGALGGNLAGGLMKSSMGTMGRSITGILGGTGLAALGPNLPVVGDMISGAAQAADGAAADAAEGGFNVKGALAGLGLGAGGGGILTAILGMFNKG